MTKRILAVVLAIVMALTMTSLSVFADAVDNYSINNGTVKQETLANGNKTVTFDWSAPGNGADYYLVTVTLGNTYIAGTSAAGVRTTSTSYSFTASASGNYDVRVKAYKNSSAAEIANISGTIAVYIAQSATGTGGLKISSNTNGGVDITWTAVAGVSSYYVVTTATDGSVYEGDVATNATAVAKSFNEIKSVVVYQGTKANHLSTTIATYNAAGTSTNPSLNASTSGNVTFNSNTGLLSWYNSSAVAIDITIGGYNRGYVAQSSTSGTPYSYYSNTRTAVYGNSLSMTGVLTNIGSSYNMPIVFTVRDYNTNTTIGTLTYTPGYYNGSIYGSGIAVTRTSTTGYRVSWNALSGVSGYTVVVSYGGAPANTYDTKNLYYDLTVMGGYEVSITVYGYGTNGNLTSTIGTATINANGTVTNGGYSNSYWYNGYNNTTSGSTVQGLNCYMVVGTNSTTVYLNYAYSGIYTCVYSVNGTNRQINNLTGSTFSIPVGAGTSFSMFCVGTSGSTGVYASATYTASSSSSATHGSSANANTPSSTKNLTLTAKSASTTTISWEKTSGATMYEVDYYRIGATSTEPIYTTKATVDIPMGKSVGFEVYVYAYVNGRPVEVGNAIHKAGDEIGATNTTTKPAETPKDEPKLSAYVTGFKGTVGTSGSITLAWNAASGNPNYEVYYKKSTASSWKRIYTTAGRALKVNKLTNGTSYDFKVVANGRDSGILTMTIGTTSSTKTAPDPDGSGSTGSATPVITSITGGTGTITVSWSAASGAVKYQVWVNPEGSTKYTKKATVDGTSATVTGLSAGSYKVRIKASKDGTTWGTFNDASCIKSDYRTVDVK